MVAVENAGSGVGLPVSCHFLRSDRGQVTLPLSGSTFVIWGQEYHQTHGVLVRIRGMSPFRCIVQCLAHNRHSEKLAIIIILSIYS